ncbi:phytoene/squalene synthase family protein [Microbacterium dextranolyticum]|uniref:Phytoene synthase n=1 Tax=Microbacterium dextranolyticum TaxID=36806 RepID=A0A9W6HMV3_9MICO|nr:squalene/phytoene synthase family protein [Microbacterium dextranolyticum]MBM7463258.1 phytoene/squalene synthetase [Microbacterium dextranolyticum]GLJ95636.1 phytoene synthase [Microbacterium dextranolyticum]
MTVPTLYDRCAEDAAAAVIATYSTSFALACRLLGPRVRAHVRNVYALVRVADEIVDGAAASAGVPASTQRLLLDDLEAETLIALTRGFSANLIVHAFARAARECGIGGDLVRPFFASMRTDLSRAEHDAASHDEYVYGSAEVVGLMCLHVFVNAGRTTPLAVPDELVEGARRLGAAFQDVNFLRDRADDRGRLGRDYLGIDDDDARTREAVLARIDDDLDAAARTIPLLPVDCRRAVTTAHGLFAELARRLRDPDAVDIRVSVPSPVKVAIAAQAIAGRPPRRSRA